MVDKKAMILTATRLAPNIREKLYKVAEAHGIPPSEYIRTLIIKDLERFNMLDLKAAVPKLVMVKYYTPEL